MRRISNVESCVPGIHFLLRSALEHYSKSSTIERVLKSNIHPRRLRLLGAQYFVYIFATQCVVLVVTREENYYVLLLKVLSVVLYYCEKILLCIIIMVMQVVHVMCVTR